MRVLVAAVLFASAASAAPSLPVIHTDSDLPPTRFTFTAPPSEAMMRDDLAAMLPALRNESERLLRNYQIDDNTIVQQLRIGLANIAVLQGRKADALQLVALYRSGETKPQRRLLGRHLLPTDLAAII